MDVNTKERSPANRGKGGDGGDPAAAEHGALCRQIAEHDRLYYVLDAPQIPDADYDRLFQRLKAIEASRPDLVTPGSPTQRVGAAPREGFTKVEHVEPMYSLDNAYTTEELVEFDRRVRDRLPSAEAPTYVVEPKIDGASIELLYRDGQLAVASTRGDGQTGEDITANIRTIRGLPLAVPDKRPLTLRGEVYIHQRDLDAINETRKGRGEEPFANPRNAASGSLRLLDAKATAERPLRVFLYDLIENHYETHGEMLRAIAAVGLPVHGLERACASIDEVLEQVDAFAEDRLALPYETDGMVIKVDAFRHRKLLGATARFPRWAVAYKYAAERAQTIVRNIISDVGRTGALTPVAELDPIKLSGTTVSRASLHNADYVAAKDVRIGDLVTVEKAGEIIPQVVEVVLAARPADALPWQPPTACPACDTSAERGEGEVALRCPNERCPGRLEAALFHFSRRSAMDIDHLGRVLIEQLVDGGLVADLADVFALPQQREALVALDRMAEKSADNLIASIEAARTGRSFARLLTGLGIPLVGAVAARLIAERYGSVEALLQDDPSSVAIALADIHGIGPKIAESVADHLRSPTQRAILEKLLALGVSARQAQREVVSGGPLEGMSFCVTGVLSEPREVIHDRIRRHGGEVHDRVKKGTTYLVIGERVGATKIAAAEKRGTKVIDEEGLAGLVGQGDADPIRG